MNAYRGIGFALLGVGALASTAHAVNLNIPAGHPRIWYGNAARRVQAEAYFDTTPFTPSGGDATELNASRALRSVVNNEPALCTQARTHLVGWRAANEGNFRDALRQQGDGLLHIYDWCWAQLSAADKATLVPLWNGYMDTENADTFANEGAGANNYFWGRARNQLLWGIASFGDNPRAQEFINHSLDTRVGQWFASWYNDFGRGGVFAEGADYGSVMLSYPVTAFQSAADFGFDPYVNSTPFFREALYALIYGSTPGPSQITGGFGGGHLLFPFNDDDTFRDGSVINVRNYLGDFARYYGSRAPTTGGNSRASRAWLTLTAADRNWMFDALGGSGSIADITSLPLDYYAPGALVFDARTGHDANAMQAHLQMGTPGGVEHRHLDAGTFQVWRKGRWLTRESAGYSQQVGGFANSGSVDTEHHVAHNGLLFQGRTTARWVGTGPTVIPPGADRGDQPDGLPEVVRLHRDTDFAFVAVDFSKAYRNTNGRRVDWPYADKAVREFLFIRPLNALLVYDRMRGSSDSLLPFYFTTDWVERNDPLAVHVSAANVVRTFVMHFEVAPVAVGNRVTATLPAPGTVQLSDLITLVPSNPVFRIFNEDRPGSEAAGQHRLELDSVGAVESYFVNVIHGRDSADPQLGASVIDNGTSYSVQLTHPTLGSATIVLVKGMTSTGGSLQIGAGPLILLSSYVQEITVTADGPVWSAPILLRDGFESPN